MIRTNKTKRTAAAIMAMVLAALCFTVFLNTPRIYAEGNDEEAPKTAVKASEYELSGKTVGVQSCTLAEETVKPYEESSRTTVQHYYSESNALAALRDKTVECLVLDAAAAEKIAAANEDIKLLEGDFSKTEYRLFIKKSNTDLYNKVNNALKKLKENKTLEKIILGYTDTDDQKNKNTYTSPEIERSGTLSFGISGDVWNGGAATKLDIAVMQAVADELKTELSVKNVEDTAVFDAPIVEIADVVSGTTSDPRLNDKRKKELSSTPYLLI